jgi:hypothetical protein
MLGYVMTYPYERCPLSVLSRVTSIYNCDDVPKLRLYDPEVLYNAMTRIRDRERQRSGGKENTIIDNFLELSLRSLTVHTSCPAHEPTYTTSDHVQTRPQCHARPQ